MSRTTQRADRTSTAAPPSDWSPSTAEQQLAALRAAIQRAKYNVTRQRWVDLHCYSLRSAAHTLQLDRFRPGWAPAPRTQQGIALDDAIDLLDRLDYTLHPTVYAQQHHALRSVRYALHERATV